MSSLDDIFGSSPPDPPGLGERHGQDDSSSRLEVHTDNRDDTHLPPIQTEPSDLPSLRRQHVTAGYRDGISASKTEHVQRGFDAGYLVGARLGMRAGTVLGILEGVLRGLEGKDTGQSKSGRGKKKMTMKMKTSDDSVGVIPLDNEEEEEKGGDHLSSDKSDIRRQAQAILAMYKTAVRELDVQSVFSGMERSASAADRTSNVREEDASEQEKPEAKLAEKGDSIVAKWEHRVRVPRWEENMEALETKQEDGGDVER